MRGERVINAGTGEKFVAVIGLPRSGTTLLTALLDRHSSLCLYYEPWNASPNARPPVPKDIAEFRACMAARFGDAAHAKGTITGFKETTTNVGTTAWAVDAIDSLSQTCDLTPIWIQRDPIHCLLSKVEGAKKWWGYPDAKFSKEVLEKFLTETENSYDILRALMRRHGGLAVRYEALVRNPADVLTLVMKSLDKPFELSQLDYYKSNSEAGLGKKVMGDPGLIEKPPQVNDDSIARRDREALQYRSVIRDVFDQPRFEALVSQFERFAGLPSVARAQLDFEP